MALMTLHVTLYFLITWFLGGQLASGVQVDNRISEEDAKDDAEDDRLVAVKPGKHGKEKSAQVTKVASAEEDSEATSCWAWCRDHVSLWATKCEWKGCASCGACRDVTSAATRDVLDVQAKTRYLRFLRVQTANGNFSLTDKMTEDELSQASVPAAECSDWCGSHVTNWHAKCSWKACGACALCGDSGPARARSDADGSNKEKYLNFLLSRRNGQEFKSWPSKSHFLNAVLQAEDSWVPAIAELLEDDPDFAAREAPASQQAAIESPVVKESMFKSIKSKVGNQVGRIKDFFKAGKTKLDTEKRKEKQSTNEKDSIINSVNVR